MFSRNSQRLGALPSFQSTPYAKVRDDFSRASAVQSSPRAARNA
jgi:hypothetical protein